MTFQNELNAACTSARLGGAAAMRFYGVAKGQIKEGGSPVTEADHASSDAILAHLAAAFPDDAILCEETVDDPVRLQARRIWIVDPLDGTKEFISQNGEFSVMIGLVVDGDPVVGAVYLPAVDELYYAAAESGAFLQTPAGTQPLQCAPADPSALRIVVSRSHVDANVERVCEALGVKERRASGSVGIKCGLIARGDADIYAHPVPYMGEWDTCAPEVILVQAGGTVTDCMGEALVYNKAEPRQPGGILACAPQLLKTVLPAVSMVAGART